MGLISSGINAWYTYKLLRRLSQKWTETPAYKAGIINEKGKKIVDKLTSSQRREYTPFDRVSYNLKRVISLVPGSQNPFIRYASALALLKEEEENDELLEILLDSIELDLEIEADESTPIVTVGSGAIDLTPSPRKKKKSLKEAIETKIVSHSSEIV